MIGSKNLVIQFLHLLRYHIYSSHLVMLCLQSGNTQSHVARSGHGTLMFLKVFILLIIIS